MKNAYQVDREIAKAESQIAKLKKKQQEQEAAAAASRRSTSEDDSEKKEEETKQPKSVSQTIYADNRVRRKMRRQRKSKVHEADPVSPLSSSFTLSEAQFFFASRLDIWPCSLARYPRKAIYQEKVGVSPSTLLSLTWASLKRTGEPIRNSK